MYGQVGGGLDLEAFQRHITGDIAGPPLIWVYYYSELKHESIL